MSSAERPVPSAVVVGLGINGLATVRALGRRGVPVTAVTTGHAGAPEATRFCHKVLCPTMETRPEDLLRTLVEVGQRLGEKAVIFPSGDASLSLISENRELLDQHYHFPFPEVEKVRIILDKAKFYRFAQENGIPIAPTFFPESLEEAERLSHNIGYPCVIKPTIATEEWRERGLKVLPARDREEFLREFARGWQVHQELVVQEVVPGPDSALYFSLAYLDRQSKCQAMFTGRKLRQNVPRFGISSMAESRWRPEVAELSLQIFRALGHYGYGSVEFKEDPRTGRLLATEVTGRTWYPHGLSERCGINLPYLAYCDLLGLAHPPIPQTYPDGVKWIDEAGDFQSAMQYHREGELSYPAWIQSYQGRRYWALATWDDPMPFARFASGVAVQAVKASGRRLLVSLGLRSRRAGVAGAAR